MMGTMEIECPFQPNAPNAENSKKLKPEEENCTINYNQLEKILYKEKNPDTLKKIWVQWFEEVARENEKTKYDFVQQLSMLDLEAEQNGI